MSMSAVKFTDSEVGKLLRGVLVIVAAGLMILPAYLNYEIWHRFSINPVVSMAISLQLFAIGVILFILAVGKERFVGKIQQQ